MPSFPILVLTALTAGGQEMPHDPLLDEIPAAVVRQPDAFRRKAPLTRFDFMVFGGPMDEESARRHLKRIMEARLVNAIETRGLSRTEYAKLRLAATGDIKHFFERVREARREGEAEEAAILPRVRPEPNPLGREFRVGPFGDGSLFDKTLRKIMKDRKAVEGPPRAI